MQVTTNIYDAVTENILFSNESIVLLNLNAFEMFSSMIIFISGQFLWGNGLAGSVTVHRQNYM